MNYLLSASLAMVIFYGLYWLAFRRLRFHALNRAYLLAALGASLVIPLVELPASAPTVGPVPVPVFSGEPPSLGGRIYSPPGGVEPSPRFTVDWNLVGWVVYLVGVGVMAFRLGIGLVRLARLARRAGRWEGGLKLIPTTGPNASFFNRIFLNETGLTAAEREQVLAHEAAHARLGHSADRLMVEVLRVAFWFNPVLGLYQRSLAHLHELQVDECMAQRFDARGYAGLLLRLHGGAALPVANLFSRQPLKDRLAALFQPKPMSKMKKLLYLSMLPLLTVVTLTLAQHGHSVPGPKPDRVFLKGARQGGLTPSGGWKPYEKQGWSSEETAENDGISVQNLLHEKKIPPTQFFTKLPIKRGDGSVQEKIIFQIQDLEGKSRGILHNWHRPGDLVRYFLDEQELNESDIRQLPRSTVILLVTWGTGPVEAYPGQFKKEGLAPGYVDFWFSTKKELLHAPPPVPPALKPERQGKLIRKAPTRVVTADLYIPTTDPAGHLELRNGWAFAYLNLNHYDPEFMESARRFFQSNGVELKVTDEQIDAYGRISSGKIQLIRKSGGPETIRASEEYTKKDGSRWVYLAVHPESGLVRTGSLPKEFMPVINALQMYLPRFGLVKDGEGC